MKRLCALAACLFRLDQGMLPASLNELLGKGLEEIPVDPYDGAPLRYDPKRGIFYTVGHDLVDDPDGRGAKRIELLEESEKEPEPDPFE